VDQGQLVSRVVKELLEQVDHKVIQVPTVLRVTAVPQALQGQPEHQGLRDLKAPLELLAQLVILVHKDLLGLKETPDLREVLALLVYRE